MGDCLADNNIKICYIFIDDMIIFGKAYEEHLEILFLVFQIERLASNWHSLRVNSARGKLNINKGNNKITELRTILQRESPNS